MQLANPFRFGAFGLLAVLLTQTATAAWLDQLFRPSASEELAAPANATQETELPPPPEPLPPSATEESVLEPPQQSQSFPASPSTELPATSEYPSAAIPSLPWKETAKPWIDEWGFGASPGLSWGRYGPPSPDVCCEEPRIKYWNHPLLAKETCGCQNTEPLTVVLTVPTDCCSVEVPVCVSACCQAVPDYESKRDLLGRMTHVYCWPCGQRVKIVDRHTGTLVVHTFQCE